MLLIAVLITMHTANMAQALSVTQTDSQSVAYICILFSISTMSSAEMIKIQYDADMAHT